MRSWIPIVLAMVTVGCSSSGFVRVGSVTAPAKKEGSHLDVFASEADVKRPFERLCMISGKTGSTLYNDRSTEGAMKRVRKAAWQCGADAVVLTSVDKKGVSLMSWGSSAASAVGIRYTGPAPSTGPLDPGTELYTASGALFGRVVSVQADLVAVALPTGGTVTVTMAQALEMAKNPAKK